MIQQKNTNTRPTRGRAGLSTRPARRVQPSRFHETSGGALKLRVIPLGGLEEVGKNMAAFELGEDIVLIDMGLMFPNEEMPGVDYVVPDVTYLKRNLKKIRGLIITHGHLDHTGAIPYLIDRIGLPAIYATKLTAGLIKERLEEFGLDRRVKI